MGAHGIEQRPASAMGHALTAHGTISGSAKSCARVPEIPAAGTDSTFIRRNFSGRFAGALVASASSIVTNAVRPTMKFLILTQYFPPEIGGAQTRLRSTASELHRMGHE